jgi:hypothetical protein
MSDAERGPDDVDALAPVIRLRPIRTLVVSSDVAYHRRAMTVLVELGKVSFAVAPLPEPDDIASLLRSAGADVVVLDATDCEAAVQRVIERLADASPRTGVVVVCHHCNDAARSLQALPKWGWTQDLRAAVELAYHDGNPLCPGALSSVRRRSALQRMAGPLRRR